MAKTYQLKLRKTDDKFTVCEKGYKFIMENKRYQELDFLNRVRKHSAQVYPFFQRLVDTPKGRVLETIHLHKVLAEKFIPKPDSNAKLYAHFLNKDPLDCRLENLVWRSQKEIRNTSREYPLGDTKHENIFQEGDFFHVLMDIGKKTRNHFGPFERFEDALAVYNKNLRK